MSWIGDGALSRASAVAAVLAICSAVSGSPFTQGDEDWAPQIQVDWSIPGSGEGSLTPLPDPLGEDRWRTTGMIGDGWRVITWSVVVDLSSGSPMLDVQSLIAKNYTLMDAQFAMSFDLDITGLTTQSHRLIGELELILAGAQGAAWIPRDDVWLWKLRADGAAKGGIFEQPWRLEVEVGSVMAFGGIDLPTSAAPEGSMGFALDLMLTPGEGAWMKGIVAVPAAPAGVLLLIAMLPRRRR